MTEMTQGRWHGHSDHATSPAFFFYTRHGDNRDERLQEQFNAVCQRLYELTEVLDANGSKVVQLIYTRIHHTSPSIAYRYTSDWAYHRYNRGVTALGLSIGRGVWEPFRDSHTFEQFVR